jgi:hypothetical protein
MMIRYFSIPILCVLSLASACAGVNENSTLRSFQKNLQSLCDKSFEGVVTSTDPEDEDWRQETLTLGPVVCPNTNTTRLPLAVGSDQSRVWTLTLQDSGNQLDFRHAHFLKDGSPDPVTNYGGVATSDNSTSTRAVFPVDTYSKSIFSENNLIASMTNTWSIEIKPNQKMTYQLVREGRNFVAEFDLENPK